MTGGLVTFLAAVLGVVALTCPHLLAVDRVYRRVGVDRDRFQRDIRRCPYCFPHLPLNRQYLLGNADVQ